MEKKWDVIDGIRAQFGRSKEWEEIYNRARATGTPFPQLLNCDGCKKEIECWGNRLDDQKHWSRACFEDVPRFGHVSVEYRDLDTSGDTKAQELLKLFGGKTKLISVKKKLIRRKVRNEEL